MPFLSIESNIQRNYRGESSWARHDFARGSAATRSARAGGPARARAWSHPVVSNGILHLKDQDLLLAYDLRK